MNRGRIVMEAEDGILAVAAASRAALVLVVCPAVASAQVGVLDPVFGTGGKSTVPFNPDGILDWSLAERERSNPTAGSSWSGSTNFERHGH